MSSEPTGVPAHRSPDGTCRVVRTRHPSSRRNDRSRWYPAAAPIAGGPPGAGQGTRARPFPGRAPLTRRGGPGGHAGAVPRRLRRPPCCDGRRAVRRRPALAAVEPSVKAAEPAGSAAGGPTCGCRAERRWRTHGLPRLGQVPPAVDGPPPPSGSCSRRPSSTPLLIFVGDRARGDATGSAIMSREHRQLGGSPAWRCSHRHMSNCSSSR